MYKVGELVRLKSGGPILTVISFNSGFANVKFYNQVSGLFVSDSFPENTLTAAATAPQSPDQWSRS